MKSGAPRPDISSVAAFRQTLLTAKSVAFTTAKSVAYTTAGASGIYFAGLLDKLGVARDVKAKARTQPGGHVAELAASGDVEIAIQMESELRGTPGADYVGPLPGDLQLYTVFSAGLVAGSSQTDAAKAFIRFLKTPEAANAYKAGGMEPVAGK